MSETAYRRCVLSGFNPAWWYGEGHRECCGQPPKFMSGGNTSGGYCWYQCEICGTRTRHDHDMPWQALKEWDAGEVFNEKPTLPGFDWMV